MEEKKKRPRGPDYRKELDAWLVRSEQVLKDYEDQRTDGVVQPRTQGL